MWVMEPLIPVRMRRALPEGESPWQELTTLQRELSWQQRMVIVGGAEIDRQRAAEAVRALAPRLGEARGQVAALNARVTRWALLVGSLGLLVMIEWYRIAPLVH